MHSPCFWVLTAKQTSRAVAVNAVYARKKKRGGGGGGGGLSLTLVLAEGGLKHIFLACLVQGKHPGLAIISVLITVIIVIVSG